MSYYDKSKQVINPTKENAYKFELFIQNFLPLVPSGKFGCLSVARETEFAPIKNPNKDGVDSPETAK